MKNKATEKNMPATKKDVELVREELKSTDKDIRHDIELMGGSLAFQIEESRQENKDKFKEIGERLNKHGRILEKHEVILEKLVDTVQELKKSVDQNTEVMSELSQEFREIKHIEFQVYNHEKRIIALEK